MLLCKFVVSVLETFLPGDSAARGPLGSTPASATSTERSGGANRGWPRSLVPIWSQLTLCLAWGTGLSLMLPSGLGFGWQAQRGEIAEGRQGMVATVHPLATEAGVAAFEQGGNAVDAAVAAAFMLGVVDGYNSGIGGGCFILIRTPDGSVYALDAREVAPAAAHREMFSLNGVPDTRLSQVGPLAVAVPGALAGYAEIAAKFGRLSLAELISPAAEVAEQGFVIDAGYAESVSEEAAELRRFTGSAAIFLNSAGEPWPVGTRLVQADLARTYRAIAAQGPEWFYRGPLAEQTAAWMKENGGIITAEDFANYRTHWREPLKSEFREYTIYGFPPPSSGGVHVAQILNILESRWPGPLPAPDTVAHVHWVAESMKLAFADRAYWLGDPAFARVPRGLMEQSYADELAHRIRFDQAASVTSHGQPPRATEDWFEKHTTHFTAVDAEGFWVAITSTVNTTFGSKVVVPGLGVVLNNQMDDFAIAPGVPNAFGLVGSAANAVEGGKRPLSSMSPTLVTRGEQPIMTVGAAGGPRIITQVVLAILRVIEHQQDLGTAVAGLRFHHQWSPDLLTVEPGWDAAAREELKALGHRVETRSAAGVTQAIRWDPDRGVFQGVADPRDGGTARGWK